MLSYIALPHPYMIKLTLSDISIIILIAYRTWATCRIVFLILAKQQGLRDTFYAALNYQPSSYVTVSCFLIRKKGYVPYKGIHCLLRI